MDKDDARNESSIVKGEKKIRCSNGSVSECALYGTQYTNAADART